MKNDYREEFSSRVMDEILSKNSREINELLDLNQKLQAKRLSPIITDYDRLVEIHLLDGKKEIWLDLLTAAILNGKEIYEAVKDIAIRRRYKIDDYLYSDSIHNNTWFCSVTRTLPGGKYTSLVAKSATFVSRPNKLQIVQYLNYKEDKTLLTEMAFPTMSIFHAAALGDPKLLLQFLYEFKNEGIKIKEEDWRLFLTDKKNRIFPYTPVDLLLYNKIDLDLLQDILQEIPENLIFGDYITHYIENVPNFNKDVLKVLFTKISITWDHIKLLLIEKGTEISIEFVEELFEKLDSNNVDGSILSSYIEKAKALNSEVFKFLLGKFPVDFDHVKLLAKRSEDTTDFFRDLVVYVPDAVKNFEQNKNNKESYLKIVNAYKLLDTAFKLIYDKKNPINPVVWSQISDSVLKYLIDAKIQDEKMCSVYLKSGFEAFVAEMDNKAFNEEALAYFLSMLRMLHTYKQTLFLDEDKKKFYNMFDILLISGEKKFLNSDRSDEEDKKETEKLIKKLYKRNSMVENNKDRKNKFGFKYSQEQGFKQNENDENENDENGNNQKVNEKISI